jgi:glycosyltransferase involved in cell wall biosynthesis
VRIADPAEPVPEGTLNSVVAISVVVPTFNSAKYLPFTLDSILTQEGANFELVVSDHGSTDGTPEVIARYVGHPRVRALVSPPGGGAHANWNQVSRAAEGEFVKLVCADDLLHPDALRRQLDALESHPRCVLVASPRRIIRSDGSVLLPKRGLGGLSGEVGGLEVVRRMVRSGTNILGEPVCVTFRRQALEEAGWWDGTLPYVIDQMTYAKTLALGDLYALDETLASFRVSSTAWTAALARQQAHQVEQFHGWAAGRHPELISPRHVRMGNLRTRTNVAVRRLIYKYQA